MRNNPVHFIDPFGLTEFENEATGDKKSVDDANTSCEVVCVSGENWQGVLDYAAMFEEGGGANVQEEEHIIVDGNFVSWTSVKEGNQTYGSLTITTRKHKLSHQQTVDLLSDEYDTFNEAASIYGNPYAKKLLELTGVLEYIKGNPAIIALDIALIAQSQNSANIRDGYHKALAYYSIHGSSAGLWLVTEVFREVLPNGIISQTYLNTFYLPNGTEFMTINFSIQ